jgi:hypothetical protein
MSSAASDPVTLARHAMATRFEIVLHGDNPVALRAAGEEALDEIERLEGQLSLYRNTTEVAHLNARAAHQPVRVSPALFRLLEHAQRLSDATEGAFDITIAPLVRCWGFMGGTGQMPSREAVEEARSKVGMKLVELNSSDFTVRFRREESCSTSVLSARLCHRSGSGNPARRRRSQRAAARWHQFRLRHRHPPDAAHWKVAIEHPPEPGRASRPSRSATMRWTWPVTTRPVPTRRSSETPVRLARRGSFERRGPFGLRRLGQVVSNPDRIFGHVIDPRTGYPPNERC